MKNSKIIDLILKLNVDTYFDEVERLINIPSKIDDLSIKIFELRALIESDDNKSTDITKWWVEAMGMEKEKYELKQEYDFLKGKASMLKKEVTLPWEMIDKNDFEALKIYRDSSIKDDINRFNNVKKFGGLVSDEIKEVLKEMIFDKTIYGLVKTGKPPMKSKTWLLQYGQFFNIVDYVKHLHGLGTELIEVVNNKSNRKILNLPQKIMLLNELGFLHCNSEQWPNNAKKNYVLSLLLSVDETNLKKNINALAKPNNKFNPHKYKGILNKLLKE